MLSGKFWKHLLLKLSAASTLLLQAFQGKGAVKRNRHQLHQNRDSDSACAGAGVQGEEQEDKGDPAHLSC